MKISICQVKSRLGGIEHNYQLIAKNYCAATKESSDIAIFPELALTGYDLKDLVSHRAFLNHVEHYKQKVVELTNNKGCALLLSIPCLENGYIFNKAILIENGEVIKKICKYDLPNYGIFDEKRNFSSNEQINRLINFRGKDILIFICEDMWNKSFVDSLLQKHKPSLIISINASPYDTTKCEIRLSKASYISTTYSIPVIYANSVGGQNELVFDGGSFVLDNSGKYAIPPVQWKEEIITFDVNNLTSTQYNKPSASSQIYQALILSIKDYMEQSYFTKAVLGLSGGIDSALTAAILCDSIGVENVRMLMIESEFTTQESINDAALFAKNIKSCNFSSIKLNDIYSSFELALLPMFKNCTPDHTEENLQARIRGVILMAISNKFNELLISTSNKSESATGYTTLYGDMSGGFSILKDLYKTDIYALSKWRNGNIPPNSRNKMLNVIPEQIINKAPSAELRHHQKDSDSLPPYEVLDKILYLLIEKDMPIADVAKKLSIKKNLVCKIKKMLQHNEFKRYQSPIGPKISIKSLSSERRYPIINHFKEV